jgi:perosamine synthetase
MALLAVGVGPGDEVIIPDFTLIVSANTVMQTGATAVVVETDPDTWCMAPQKIEERIGPRTRAIMAVHMYGHPCDMPAIMEIAGKHGLKVIEDCAEAQGAEINGRKVGSFGDVVCFSFYANKIITTGEGGMALCNDAALAESLRLLRNQGFDKPRFVHNVMGFNYRLTNMQAAIGVAQLEMVEEIVAQKRREAQAYIEILGPTDLFTLPYEAPGAKNVYWMVGIVLKPGAPVTKDALMERLYQNGIETRSFFCPMHLQPVFRSMNPLPHPSFAEDYPVSQYLWENGFYLPSGMALNQAEIEEVCQRLLECYRQG